MVQGNVHYFCVVSSEKGELLALNVEAKIWMIRSSIYGNYVRLFSTLGLACKWHNLNIKIIERLKSNTSKNPLFALYA